MPKPMLDTARGDIVAFVLELYRVLSFLTRLLLFLGSPVLVVMVVLGRVDAMFLLLPAFGLTVMWFQSLRRRYRQHPDCDPRHRQQFVAHAPTSPPPPKPKR
ncbi:MULTISPECIES: hypothetical protein [unclassified Yoonia]|uniref:hypothetical protein n=1 Tax=unclassified Yoonia TaxID=2629118 RepID=UPI002AFF38F2|nr:MULTISPECIES: hypothetical protein [unclassified Yoonia]